MLLALKESIYILWSTIWCHWWEILHKGHLRLVPLPKNEVRAVQRAKPASFLRVEPRVELTSLYMVDAFDGKYSGMCKSSSQNHRPLRSRTSKVHGLCVKNDLSEELTRDLDESLKRKMFLHVSMTN